MSLHVMYGNDGPGQRECGGLCPADPDEQCADEPWANRDAERVDLLERDARLAQRLVYHVVDDREVGSSRKLRDDSTVDLVDIL